MKTIKIISILFAALLLSACSKKKNFSIQGNIEGIGSQMVTATFYADGGLKRISASASNDVFSLTGTAKKPTLISLTLSDGTQIATLIMSNGDKAKLKGDINSPFSIDVSANSDSEKIASWVNDNAELLQTGNAEAINLSLANWVGKHTSSKASTALMLAYFHSDGYEHLADSLITLLTPEARAKEVMQNYSGTLNPQLGALTEKVQGLQLFTSTDSLIAFSPLHHKAMLLCFMPDNNTARDTISPTLRRLTSTYPKKKFRAVEISTAIDSAAWRKSIEGDSAIWSQTWIPSALSSTSIRKLAVPRTPYFIVADSAGGQIYRGSSISAACHAVESKLK